MNSITPILSYTHDTWKYSIQSMLTKILTSLIVLLCFANTAAFATNYNLPDYFEHLYTLKRDGSTVGEIKRTLKKQGAIYSFRSESRTTGFISLFYKDNIHEQTTWEMDGNDFKPLHYQYQRTRKGKERNIKITFEWENNRIITTAKGSNWTMPLKENIYDKLLYEVVIMQKLQRGEEITEFVVADGGTLKTYYFKNLGEELLETPIGAYQTIKLERHKSSNDKTLTIWYAKELDFIPVKVENIDGEGKTVTAIIKQISPQ